VSEPVVLVELSRIVINERSKDQVIYLREEGTGRELALVVGMFEADSIYRFLQDLEPRRPLTHDLMSSLIGELGAGLERVVVDGLEDEIYRATLELRRGEELIKVDARPSDAVSIALRLGAPMAVAQSVFEAAVTKG